jgi:F-type H+-transporting ATPase subunit b
MHADPSTWYLIAFVIFVLLLGRTVWRVSIQMLDEKIKRIRKEIEEAAHMKKEAEDFLEHAQQKQKETQEQANKILSLSEREIQRIQRDAKQERKEFLASQERQLQERLVNLESIAMKELNENIIQTAIGSAESVIQKNLDRKLDAALIRETLKMAESLQVPVAS